MAAARTRSAVSHQPVTLRIKNMVCDRCIRVVREELSSLGLEVGSVTLGTVVVQAKHANVDLNRVRARLRENGFDLLDNKNLQTVERIKTAVLRLVRPPDGQQLGRTPLSSYLSRELGREYHYLSTLFSSVEHITIETYYIHQRIERVKEHLVYDELTLSEIAAELGYSSVQHLSNQFRQVTGLTPTAFKQFKHPRRTPLDRVS